MALRWRVNRSRAGSRRQRGQAVLEFGLVAIMMIAMFFGVFEFGRAFYSQLKISHAARDGARVGIDPMKTDAQIQAAASAAAAPLTLAAPATVNRSVAGQVTVTASYTFTSPVPLVGTFTISRSMVARINGP